MASGKAKYDPLEAAKLGTSEPPAAVKAAFEAPKAAQQEAPAAGAPPARPRPRYRLLKDKRVSMPGGMICDYRAGRIFDSAGYDIDKLKASGCELELVTEE